MELEGIWLKVGAKFDEAEKALAKLPFNAQKAADEMSAAFKNVGIRNLEKEFRDAQTAFDLLERSGTLTAKQLADAADNVKAKWAAWKEEIDTSGQALQQFSQNAIALGGALTAAVTAPLVALGKTAFDAAESLDGAFDKIRVGTGATGAQLDALQGSFRNLFADVPNDANQVAEALTEISKRTGQVGPGLENLARQFLDLSRITGEQIGPAIAKTTRLFGDWSIEASKQAGTMDMLFRVSQQTGISFTALADKLVYAGAPFRQLGFSIEQSAIMLGKFEKEGVNVELVIGAMRTALAKFGKAGEEPVEAFRRLVESIKNADVAQGNLIAAQVVGTKRMADFAAAVREGRLDLDGLFKTVMNSGETIKKAAEDTADYGEAWQKLKNQVTLALEPLGAILFNTLTKIVQQMQPAINLVSELAKNFAALPAPVQTAAIGFAALAAAVGPVLVAIGGMAAAWPTVVSGMGMLGVSAGALTGTFAALGAAIGVAAAAFAAFSAVKAFQAFREAEKDAAAAGQMLSTSVARLEATAAKMGITVDKTGKSVEQYAVELNKAVRAHPDYQAKLEAAAKAQAQMPPAVDASAAAVARLVAQQGAAITAAMKSASAHGESAKAVMSAADAHRKAAEAAAAHAKGLELVAELGRREMDRLAAAATKAARETDAAFAALQQGLSNIKVDLKAIGREGVDYLESLGIGIGELSDDIQTASRETADQVSSDSGRIQGGMQNVGKQTDLLGRQISTVFTDFSRNIADAILKWDGFAEAGKKAVMAVAEVIVRSLVEGALKAAMKGLSSITDQLGGIGRSIAGIFGGGASGVTGAAGGAGGAGGALGGAAGAAGGALGVVGAIGSIGTMVSSIIGNFQFSAMNKTLDLIEKEVRYSQIHLKNMLEFANQWWPWMENLKYLQIMESLERATYESVEYLRAMSGGGQVSQYQQTTINWLKSISEGVWATYSAVSKPGWQTNTTPPRFTTPGVPTTGTPISGAPNTTVNVNVVNSGTANPYTLGMTIAQGINAALPARTI